MNLAVLLAIILCTVVSGVALYNLRGLKFNAIVIARIGLVAALTVTLYMIKLAPFPQGGGCSLLSVLPLMIYATIFGAKEAIMCGFIVGCLKIIVAPPYFPMQLPLDYFTPMIALGFTPLFGRKKMLLGLGAVIACSVATFSSILSGIIFFGQYAPEGMHVWVYSTVYNVSGFGVEALASIVVLLLLPIQQMRRILKGALDDEVYTAN